jgi:type IV secretory pathway TrbD component
VGVCVCVGGLCMWVCVGLCMWVCVGLCMWVCVCVALCMCVRACARVRAWTEIHIGYNINLLPRNLYFALDGNII